VYIFSWAGVFNATRPTVILIGIVVCFWTSCSNFFDQKKFDFFNSTTTQKGMSGLGVGKPSYYFWYSGNDVILLCV
jgi:hypothetical protein